MGTKEKKISNVHTNEEKRNEAKRIPKRKFVPLSAPQILEYIIEIQRRYSLYLRFIFSHYLGRDPRL